MASSFFKLAAAAICRISSTRRTSSGSPASSSASLTVSLSRLGKAHSRPFSHVSDLLHLMGRKALGQLGEFRDRLAHRLIGDPLGGLDETDVDRDPARIDPLVELPNRLFGRR